jgi:hypothetical protein
MESNKLKQLLRGLVNEEAVPGIDNTKRVNDESKKFNDEYQKEVESKMKDYESNVSSEEDETTDIKYSADDKQKEYHDEMEILNGQESVTYDQEPSDRFKERAEMSLKGDTKMGNKVHTGKWNPETGEGNGNTESTWGASDDKFGEKLVDRMKSSNKKRNDATKAITQFGDDIELGQPTEKTDKKIAIKENTGMKRLRFKKPFNGEDNALQLIPEHYKVDDKVFEMTDGNETYKVRWEGTLTEGEAVVLESENAKLIQESRDKVFKLMNFDTKKAMGTRKGKDRVEENKKFSDFMGKAKSLIKESSEIDYNQNDWSGQDNKIKVNKKGEFKIGDSVIRVTGRDVILIDGEESDWKLVNMGDYYMATDYFGDYSREHKNKYVAVAQLAHNLL